MRMCDASIHLTSVGALRNFNANVHCSSMIRRIMQWLWFIADWFAESIRLIMMKSA